MYALLNFRDLYPDNLNRLCTECTSIAWSNLFKLLERFENEGINLTLEDYTTDSYLYNFKIKYDYIAKTVQVVYLNKDIKFQSECIANFGLEAVAKIFDLILNLELTLKAKYGPEVSALQQLLNCKHKCKGFNTRDDIAAYESSNNNINSTNEKCKNTKRKFFDCFKKIKVQHDQMKNRKDLLSKALSKKFDQTEGTKIILETNLTNSSDCCPNNCRAVDSSIKYTKGKNSNNKILNLTEQNNRDSQCKKEIICPVGELDKLLLRSIIDCPNNEPTVDYQNNNRAYYIASSKSVDNTETIGENNKTNKNNINKSQSLDKNCNNNTYKKLINIESMNNKKLNKYHSNISNDEKRSAVTCNLQKKINNNWAQSGDLKLTSPEIIKDTISLNKPTFVNDSLKPNQICQSDNSLYCVSDVNLLSNTDESKTLIFAKSKLLVKQNCDSNKDCIDVNNENVEYANKCYIKSSSSMSKSLEPILYGSDEIVKMLSCDKDYFTNWVKTITTDIEEYGQFVQSRREIEAKLNYKEAKLIEYEKELNDKLKKYFEDFFAREKLITSREDIVTMREAKLNERESLLMNREQTLNELRTKIFEKEKELYSKEAELLQFQKVDYEYKSQLDELLNRCKNYEEEKEQLKINNEKLQNNLLKLHQTKGKIEKLYKELKQKQHDLDQKERELNIRSANIEDSLLELQKSMLLSGSHTQFSLDKV